MSDDQFVALLSVGLIGLVLMALGVFYVLHAIGRAADAIIDELKKR